MTYLTFHQKHIIEAQAQMFVARSLVAGLTADEIRAALEVFCDEVQRKIEDIHPVH